MMSLTFGLFTQVSDLGPQGPFVSVIDNLHEFVPGIITISPIYFSVLPLAQ